MGAMFILLPITSVPLLSRLFGGTAVAPLAVVPAIFLVVFLILPTVFKSQLFSIQFKPLILFFLFALASTFLILFKDTPSFRSIHPIKNALESIITFLMGLSFYYVTTHFLTTKEKIEFAIKWINIGALFFIVFSLIQAVYIHTPIEVYPNWLAQLTYKISSSQKIFPRRISGLTFEPSWLAHQLNILYLPLWLGLSLKGYSVYKFRIHKKITIENILLVIGLVLLFLSYSRIGWITFLVLVFYLLITTSNKVLNKIIHKTETRRKTSFKNWEWIIAKTGMWLLVIVTGLGLALLAGLLLTKLDPIRTAELLNIEAIKNLGILGWANLIKVAERLVYWIIGFKTFQLHPWIGVGLGAVGYYFPSLVPSFGYLLPDVVHFINIENFIPNAKNLWARLLAETGIIGTALFVSWVYLHWKSAKELEKERDSKFFQAMGLVGKLFVIAFVIEGFSMDTFGLPYYWVAFGLLVATWRIMKHAQKEEYLTETQESKLAKSGV